ncbi:hypothetical protein LCER1_G006694 [Lachnellula cervina]|uniref:Uncharacterized protein n=1 Tax=Lachnellula cervina TaxID=1316786 RepID=A0A7D8Z112_9HELO|nr:hypothetical protein LCER1_G006694 [Lachnellula cervina]
MEETLRISQTNIAEAQEWQAINANYKQRPVNFEIRDKLELLSDFKIYNSFSPNKLQKAASDPLLVYKVLKYCAKWKGLDEDLE